MYSTASTSDAAYIIGGLYSQEIVAEFKDNKWRRLDDLYKGRRLHGSLSVGDQTIIIGGYVESERSVTVSMSHINDRNEIIII